ncbi:MAG TPA: hypothetical protein VII37_11120, partial [Candidatus Acidoferrum sp.]
ELRQMVDPPYPYYYLQGIGQTPVVIKGSDFRICERGRHGSEPIVLSVDTALRSGPSHSYNVIQAWAFDGTNHLLREQFRQRCSYEVLEDRFYAMAKHFRCYAAIIEEAANGSSLIRFAEKIGIDVVPVNPSTSKAHRLAEHAAIIRQGRIHLARHLFGEFIFEVENFPRNGSDQIDPCSQYLTHRPPPPRVEQQHPVSIPAAAFASRFPRNAMPSNVNSAAIAYGSQVGNYAPPTGTGWHTLRSSSIGK